MEPVLIALFALFLFIDLAHELHEHIGDAPSLLDVEMDAHHHNTVAAAQEKKERGALFWLFLEGPTFVLPLAGEIARAAGAFTVKNFNVGRRVALAPLAPPSSALLIAHESGSCARRCIRP